MVSDLLRSLVGRWGFVGFFVTKSQNTENRVTYYVDVPLLVCRLNLTKMLKFVQNNPFYGIWSIRIVHFKIYMHVPCMERLIY